MTVCVCVCVVCCRISGDTALTRDIHENVSKQMQANWAKLKWKVRRRDGKYIGVAGVRGRWREREEGEVV